jgi:hypothetical protein
LSRSVTESSNSDSAINLSGNAVVFVTPRATDLPFTDGAVFTAPITVGNGSTSAGSVKFLEDSDNGTNGITLSGPASTSDVTFTLPSADGSADTFLKTDGSGNLSFATAGGADLYSVNTSGSPTNPTSTGTGGVAIGDGCEASGTAAVAIGRDSKASTYSVAIGETAQALGANSIVIGRNDSASASYLAQTVQIGGQSTAKDLTNNQVCIGMYAVTDGEGSVAFVNSRAAGTHGFAAAIQSNSSSYGTQGGTVGNIAMGRYAKCDGGSSVAIGNSSKADGSNDVAIGVNANCENSGGNQVALGYNATTNYEYGTAIGYNSATNSVSQFAFQGHGYRGEGEAQFSLYNLLQQTTDATQATMSAYSGTSLDKAQIMLPNYSLFRFKGTVMGRQSQSTGTDMSAFDVEGLITREANAGTTTLITSSVTTVNNAGGFGGVALSADTTNGALSIKVTGKSSTTIRWLGSIQTNEIVYPY